MSEQLKPSTSDASKLGPFACEHCESIRNWMHNTWLGYASTVEALNKARLDAFDKMDGAIASESALRAELAAMREERDVAQGKYEAMRAEYGRIEDTALQWVERCRALERRNAELIEMIHAIHTRECTEDYAPRGLHAPECLDYELTAAELAAARQRAETKEPK